MSEPRPGSLGDWGELEAAVATVRLEELLSILRRHVRLIVAVVAVVVAGSGLAAYAMGPVYRAVAVIRLSDPRRAFTGGLVADPARLDERFDELLLSQVELLKSRTVAGAVVDSVPMLRIRTEGFPLSLLREVEVPPAAAADSFQILFDRDGFTAVGSSGQRSAAYGAAVEIDGIRFALLRRPKAVQGRLRVLGREAAISGLRDHLRVRPRPRTDIVDVAYSAPDPHIAQQVVNRVVDIFRTVSAEAAQGQARRRREFLEAQLEVNDSLLAQAREALTEFHRRTGAYGSPEALAREQIALGEIGLQRQQMDTERRTYEGLLESLQGRDQGVRRRALQTALSMRGVAAHPAVAELSAQLFRQEAARDSLASRSASHPDLSRLGMLISSTEAKLFSAVQADLRSSVESLDARITAMDRYVRGRQQELADTEAEEARLRQRVENAQKVAAELRIAYQQAGIAEAVTVGQVEIVDHAPLPAEPTGIGLAEQLVLGLLVGLLLGTGGAVLADRLGRAIARPAQVEGLGLSLLGVVTHFRRDGRPTGAKGANAVIEAFRGVRLGLANAYGAAPPIVITVTSPGSGDGKSFVSSNLALAFAYAGHRTFLVDADLRRGVLHRSLNLPRQPGLTDFLAGGATREQVVRATSYPRLDFLASGSRRGDAPELLGSPAMADLMTHLRSTYDVIVLDTAPLGAGVDALTLGALAGNVLIVLRLGRTDRQLAEAKLEVLRRLPLRLLGAVLNDVGAGSEYSAYAYYMDGYELTNEPPFRPLAAGGKGLSPRRAD